MQNVVSDIYQIIKLFELYAKFKQFISFIAVWTESIYNLQTGSGPDEKLEEKIVKKRKI